MLVADAPDGLEPILDETPRADAGVEDRSAGDPAARSELPSSAAAVGPPRLVPMWVAALALCAIVALAVAAGFLIRGALASTRDATLRQLDAVEHARALALRDPKDARAHLDLARTYIGAGKQTSALEEYDTILKANPFDIAALYGRGTTLLSLGQEKPGTDDLWKILGRDKGHVGAATALGKHYADTGQYRLVVSAVRPAAQLHPNEAGLQYLMGRAYEQLGHLDWATVRYQLALKADPGLPEALAGLKRLTSNP